MKFEYLKIMESIKSEIKSAQYKLLSVSIILYYNIRMLTKHGAIYLLRVLPQRFVWIFQASPDALSAI